MIYIHVVTVRYSGQQSVHVVSLGFKTSKSLKCTAILILFSIKYLLKQMHYRLSIYNLYVALRVAPYCQILKHSLIKEISQDIDEYNLFSPT